jgi:hypothetical protein
MAFGTIVNVTFSYLVKGKDVTFTTTYRFTGVDWRFSWDFGDGSTATGFSAMHTYAKPGTYKVVFTGVSPDGRILTSTSDVTITADTAPGPPTVTTGRGTVGDSPAPTPKTTAVTGTDNDASGILSLFDNLFSSYEKEPARLREIIKETISGLSIAASVLSFIPFTNNFGGALASVLIHGLIEPFRRRAYDASIDLALRPIMPDLDLNARILVSGIEIGALSEKDLTEELARSGVRDPAINLALQVARVKRFDVETKDDIALIRSYQRDIHTAVINTLQDAEKDIIGDLKRRRTEVLAELRKVRA